MRLAFLCLAGLAFTPLAGCSAEAVPAAPALARLVPADALVVVETDRLAAVRERWRGSAWAALLGDERVGLTDVWAPQAPEASVGESQARGDESTFRAFLATVEGRALFYVRRPRDGHSHAPAALLVESAAGESAVADLFAQVRSDWTAEGGLRVESHAGVNLFVKEERDETRVLLELPPVHALLFADGDEAIEEARALVDRMVGASEDPGILSRSGFVSRRGHIPDSVVQAFVQVDQAIAAALEDSGAGDEEVERVLDGLGLKEIEWLHAALWLGEGERLGASLSLHLPSDTFLGRLTDQFGPLPTRFFDRLPAECTSVGAVGLDLRGLLRETLSLLDRFPESRPIYDEVLTEARAELGVDLEVLLPAFSGRFASLNLPVPPEEILPVQAFALDADPSRAQGTAYLVELSKPAVVQDAALAILAKLDLAEQVEEIAVGEHVLHRLDAGPVPLAWAFVDDYVVVGPHPTAVMTVLRFQVEGGESAAQTDRIAEAVRAYGDCSSLSVSVTHTWVDTALQAAQGLGFFFGGGALTGIPLFGKPLDGPVATDYFQGTTITGFRRDGDVAELFFETR